MRNAHDRSRYLIGLMRKSLAAYRDGGLDLAGLAYDVESLLRSLDEVADQDWVAELRTVWWNLEEQYATCLDEGRSTSPEELVVVDEVVRSIERLLSRQDQ